MWQLGWRLSELVPLDMNERQRLLEIDDPLERLTRIEKLVSEMANGSKVLVKAKTIKLTE